MRADAPVAGKVALATGGGSGHLPVFLGYVGKGMLDGCAVGDVFASPSADQMIEVTKRIHGGAGVVYIYGNYGGDIMNFDMAAELAGFEGIAVRTVLVRDDVASAPPSAPTVAAGSRAWSSGSRSPAPGPTGAARWTRSRAAAEKALANTRSMGVALSPCTVPMAGKPTFAIGEDEMEIGMGIHGEPGRRREKLQTADRIAEAMTEAILEDLKPVAGDRLAVMINGLGATPPEELYILYRKVHDILTGEKLAIHRAYVGEFATSMEMAGASLLSCAWTTSWPSCWATRPRPRFSPRYDHAL